MQDSLVTFIVPVAPYHTECLPSIRGQVNRQTIQCKLEIVIDKEAKGAAWARNKGVERASTPFVVFLDADDYVLPSFAEKMLAAYKPGHYVYSEYLHNGAPSNIGVIEDMMIPENHHVVNCLIRKSTFLSVGGFNETKIGFEDTEFWLRCASMGVCPVYCNHTLVYYDREYSDGVHPIHKSKMMRNRMLKLYREYFNMSCCGQSGAIISRTLGTQKEDFVEVRCMWGGNQTHRGKVTGNVYERNGNGKLAWVHKDDAAADTTSYQIVKRIEDTPEKGEEEAIKTTLDNAEEELPNFMHMSVKELMLYAEDNNIELPENLPRPSLAKHIRKASEAKINE